MGESLSLEVLGEAWNFCGPEMLWGGTKERQPEPAGEEGLYWNSKPPSGCLSEEGRKWRLAW